MKIFEKWDTFRQGFHDDVGRPQKIFLTSGVKFFGINADMFSHITNVVSLNLLHFQQLAVGVKVKYLYNVMALCSNLWLKKCL